MLNAQLVLKKGKVGGEFKQKYMDTRFEILILKICSRGFFEDWVLFWTIVDAMFCAACPNNSPASTIPEPIGISLMYGHWSLRTNGTVSSRSGANEALKYLKWS